MNLATSLPETQGQGKHHHHRRHHPLVEGSWSVMKTLEQSKISTTLSVFNYSCERRMGMAYPAHDVVHHGSSTIGQIAVSSDQGSFNAL